MMCVRSREAGSQSKVQEFKSSKFKVGLAERSGSGDACRRVDTLNFEL
jgi:hypothetical protein